MIAWKHRPTYGISERAGKMIKTVEKEPPKKNKQKKTEQNKTNKQKAEQSKFRSRRYKDISLRLTVFSNSSQLMICIRSI